MIEWVGTRTRPRGLFGPCGSQYEVGKAAGFNGSTSYLERASTSVFSGSSVAIGVWVYLNSKTSEMEIAGKYDNTAGFNNEWVLFYHSGLNKLRFSMTTAASGSSVNANSFGSPPTGAWFHVWAWVEASQACISVNDGTVDIGSAASGSLNTNKQAFRLGRTNDGAWPLDGRLDEVLVYSQVPSADVRTSIYNAGAGKTYSDLSAGEKINLLSAYPLGEIDGVTTYCDFHGSAHLTPSNMAQIAGKI